jgi:hypothetical protein
MATNELPAPRYDVVQTLTDDVGTTIGQKTQARKNIYAAPFDALAYNGMQVNGSMEVSQERGTATFSGLGNICDGWLTAGVGSAVLSSSIAASGVMTTNGIPFYLGSTVTTASPTLAAGDNFNLQQRIEGYRIARLGWGSANAKPITISFWTDHVRTGTYSVTVRNGASTRSYATTYTQVGSGVWQYNTVTITGCTDGVWAIDNTNGMSIIFSMGSGTTSTAPSANGWVVGSFTAAPGQINAVAATSDIFRITGVVVLPGIEAPTAAQSPLIMRPYDQELVTCQRYYRKLIDKELTGQFTSASAVYLHASFGVPFRAAPALTLLITTPTIIEIGVGGRVGVASAITTGASTTMGGYAEINGFSGATARTAAVGGTISISADARL